MPKFGDVSFKAVPVHKFTPGEVAAVEKVVGESLPKIRRRLSTCVCGHLTEPHTHKDANGEVSAEDTSCTQCDCPAHEPDAPISVNMATLWIAARRADQTITWAAFNDQPMDEYEDDEEAVEPDPTSAPAEGHPETV